MLVRSGKGAGQRFPYRPPSFCDAAPGPASKDAYSNDPSAGT
jgi:hypothetical protein